MSSYYNRVTGTLNASEIARSEDIHLIQSGIQSAIQEMIRDIFGAGCILGEEENSLELTSTPYHIDQENHNYDEEESFISFYDRYLRQVIDIDKSEIQSIKVEMQNNSNIAPTVYAEICDTNLNVLKESNIVLTPTNNESEVFTFNFNLNHLPLGEYYFCLRPVDIESVDVDASEEPIGTIDSDSFKIKFDRSGNYKEGLEASYNGVDYLEARLLGDQVNNEDMNLIPYDNNFDLWFEHIFSEGNTYVIEPAPCMVMGEKVYPIDTHITLDGPSPEGDRIDLVTLTPDGYLNVIKGLPFLGEKTEENYPVENSGLKIAYITTYQTSEPWTCPNCGTTNDANITSCSQCGTNSISTKIPLIEQDDENGITRMRDVLERLRRLEKRMDYNEDHNTPSRIKYTCDIDPTLIIDNGRTEDNNELIWREDTYDMNADEDDNGNPIVIATSKKGSKVVEWTIVDKVTTTVVKKESDPAILTVYNLTIPTTRPKKVDKSKHYFHAKVQDRKTKKGLKGIPITFTIKNKNKKVIKTLRNIKTKSNGTIELNIWSYKLKKGTYTITATHRGTSKKSISATLKLTGDNYTKATGSKSQNIAIPKTITKTTTDKIDKNKTFVGDDSFYKDSNINFDHENGVVSLGDAKVKKADFKTVGNLTSTNKKELDTSTQQYKIKKTKSSLQSDYAALSFQITKKCKIKSITPPIKKFKNIKAFTIILFKNNKVFNINTSRKSYTKNTKPNVDKTFTDIYNVSDKTSKWVNLKKKGKKDSKGITKLTKAHKFTFKETILEPGTYTMVVLGILDNPKKDGIIYVQEYHTSNATKYGGTSRLKGTSSTKGPKKLYIEANSLNNRTWFFEMDKADIDHHREGTLISKTLSTQSEITSVTIYPNFYIPNGCSITTYVSNNGGKTYIEAKGKKTTVTFNGTGKDFKWRLELKGTKNVTPKLYYNSKKKYAIRFKLHTIKKTYGYEDYGKCFSTPILNANAITRNVLENNLITNKFEEWEYCRLWMEDEDLNAKIDICFSYANGDNTTHITTPQKNWPATMFFSQVFANLDISDFTQESVDYDNYIANVEPDEHNYRFKLDSDYTGNAKSEIIAKPIATDDAEDYRYTYGDITNEEYNMGDYFSYGLMSTETNYLGNTGDTINVSTGLHMTSGPYFQAMFDPNPELLTQSSNTKEDQEEDDDTSNNNTSTNNTSTNNTSTNNTSTNDATDDDESTENTTQKICVWASDDEYNIEYAPEACIIGISFEEGLEIKDQYTHLMLDIIPNLRDCQEDDPNTGALKIVDGKPILNYVSDDSKYQYGEGHMYEGSFYIPKNTLEVVAALNPYGLIENNDATYGKAFLIDQDLISCVHNQVALDLSDLYGTTIYSIGIRISNEKDSKGNYLVQWTTGEPRKHRSLHKGDIIGIGNLYLESYNKKSYAHFLYSGSTSRWKWKKSSDNKKSRVLGQFHMIKAKTKSDTATTDRTTPYWSQFDLITKKTNSINLAVYKKEGTKLSETNYILNNFKYDDGSITTTFKDTKNNQAISTKYNNTNETGDIIFCLAKGELGNLFEIKTNISLTPYDYINVKYHLDYPGQNATGSERGFSKGDIFIDLYDTDDIHNVEPIEKLPLPAWGKIQNRATTKDKTVNAWFKKHSNATSVKKIVLRRANATQEKSPEEFKLHLTDILFMNTPTLPALGPQMHVRIYPKDMTNLENTKIRKFGCVYRIG